MPWWDRLKRRLRQRWQQSRYEQELAEEMRYHLDRLREDEGLSPAEVRRRFGNSLRLQEESHGMWTPEWWETWTQDAKYALRQLAHNPGFAAVAVLALGLGIGANTAMFSAVDALIVRSLPFRDADRLVMVWEDASYVGFPKNTPAPANYVDWRQQNTVFEDMAAGRPGGAILTGGGNAELVRGYRLQPHAFQLLGVQPALGRIWSAQEDLDNIRAVVLSHGLWLRRFGGDTSIVGRTIQMSGQGVQVLGVMPPGFFYPDREVEFYQPSGLTAQQLARRGSHFLSVLAKLKPDVTVDRARTEMVTIARRLEQQYPETNTKVSAVVVPLQDDMLGDTRPQMLVLLAASACVLLIACANVANLLLARAAARQREMAVRTALGAGTMRLLRQTLTESMVLSFAGMALGLVLALGGIRLLRTMVPEGYVGQAQLALDWRVLGFTLLAALVTGLLFGLAPAIGNARAGLHDTLKQGTRGSSARRGWLRNALVVSEVGLSLVLLVTTGLLLQTLVSLRGQEPGFQPDHLLVARLSLAAYTTPEAQLTFTKEVLRQLQSVPGVELASFASNPPFLARGNTNGFRIEGAPPEPPGSDVDALVRGGNADYLKLLGVRLREGRLFEPADDQTTSPYVMVINRKMADRYFANTSAVGHRVQLGGPDSPWYRIVGVVEDIRERGFLEKDKFAVYTTLAQAGWWRPEYLVVRTKSDPLAILPEVRRVVRQLNPNVPLDRVRTMDEVMERELAQRSRQMCVLAAFAGVALVLAFVGLYGVLAYAVSQRTREIGIRMALGAQGGNVIADVVKQGANLTLAGIAAGAVGAWALARAFQNLLFGVAPYDPRTYVGVAVGLLLIALVACYLPARRAAGVDPVRVLRED